MSTSPLHVAIIGGGLCGLSLAIALTKRDISYTIYEARGSFSEIGAGINLGPNTIQAFDLIDPLIGEKVFALATRNEPGKETIWMNVRLGAPTKNFEDAHLVSEIQAPPTGNMTVSRNELLQLLAKSTKIENARFNKKIASIEQTDSRAEMTFEDGSRDHATIVIGCDGAHSTVRKILLGADHPAANAVYSHTGGYRAVFPMAVHERAVGLDKAHSIQVFLGPAGYTIVYPIDGAKNVNIGLWPWKRQDWTPSSWILPRQKQEMLKDFEAWGPTVHRIMDEMDDETAFWATFHYSNKPESYFNGRLCVIGDASHAMTPHQGQGAAQSMEDACVIAEVLQQINTGPAISTASSQSQYIEAAFFGYQTVRKSRFEAVLDTSNSNYAEWASLWKWDITQSQIDAFDKVANEKFWWLWKADLPGQAKKAVETMEQRLESGRRQEDNKVSKLA